LNNIPVVCLSREPEPEPEPLWLKVNIVPGFPALCSPR
jgi:hypothetical protein